jgi:SNF2 family DNA or RNA helicase
MEQHIEVDYCDGRYLATVPLQHVQRVRALPGARYDPRKGRWIIANIAYNRRQLRRWPTVAVALSSAASEALHHADDESSVLKIPFPPAYPWRTTPFAHQRAACDAAYGRREFALFMEMGTGKTKVAIDLAAAYAMAGEIDRVLVICPLTVRGAWGREIAAHMPFDLRPSVFLLSSKQAAFGRWMAATDTEDNEGEKVFRWAIVGVESLSIGGAANVVAGFVTPRTLVIVDESTRIKSHRAKRSQVAVALGAAAGYRMILTGAPITKGIEDLFGQFRFLSSDILGTDNFFAFRNTYCVMGGWQGKAIIGYQNTDRLMSDLRPYVYQITKAEALDLPPKIYTTREVPLAPDQRAAYAQAVKDAKISLVGTELTLTNVLTKLLRMHQIAQGFVGFAGEADAVSGKAAVCAATFSAPKIDELLTVLEEITGSVIIWCVYHAEIDRVVAALRTRFPTEHVVELHGRISEVERGEAIAAFQAGKARFIVGNPATGGLGVTLTRAETVIYMSNGFSLEHRMQSEDRAHRVGTVHPVTYIDLIAPDTVDVMVGRALRTKRNLSEFVRDALNTNTFWSTMEG